LKYIILVGLLTICSCNLIESIGLKEEELSQETFTNKTINQTLRNNIEAFWRFEESTGSNRVDIINGIILVDQTGSSAVRTAGVYGYGVDTSAATSGSGFFQNNNGFLKAATDDFAMSAWIYKTTNPVGGCGIPNKVFSLNGLYVEIADQDCQSDHADVQYYLGAGPGVVVNDAIDFSSNPGWHHFVLNVTDTGAKVDFYIDGQLVGSGTGPSSSISSAYLIIGSDSAGAERVEGKIDSVGFWDRLLTTQEIEDLYNGNNDLDTD
jgi:hypothetical protein